MKTNTALPIFVIVCAFIGTLYFVRYVQTSPPTAQPIVDRGYKNATYQIEKEHVKLSDGNANTAQGKIRYFGNEARGDLNGDGIADVAFLLTVDGGGSGLFYYVVSAIKIGNEYHGTNAIVLGDRIAPQTTEIRDGQLLVNYADRSKNEPMSAKPSVGVTMRLKFSGTRLVPVK